MTRCVHSMLCREFLLATCVALAPAALGSHALAQSTERVSVATGGEQANAGANSRTAVSSDGRFVVFVSTASNLVPNDTNGGADVFVRDRINATTTRVNVSSAGAQAVGSSSWNPDISDDGRYVAFWSTASNLVVDDTNGIPDLFVHDALTGETTRANVTSAGAQATDVYYSGGSCAISGDGRFVAFDHPTNLAASATNLSKIYVRDRLLSTTTIVSVGAGGVHPNGTSFNPTLSADGRFVAFESGGSNLVANDFNFAADVFVHDRQTGVTTLESTSFGAQANFGAGNPSISDDGMSVAFFSWSTNLVLDDTNGWQDVFVRNRGTGLTVRASVSSAGVQANASSEGVGDPPRLSADGRFVAFRCSATNLISGGASAGHVYVHDMQRRETVAASVSSRDEQGNGVSLSPAISGNGRLVVFQSNGSNLVVDDTNGVADIFVRDLGVALALGDLNNDGVVNGADLGAMLAAWGVCIFGCPEDLNDDWMVNGTDLGLLLANWS